MEKGFSRKGVIKLIKIFSLGALAFCGIALLLLLLSASPKKDIEGLKLILFMASMSQFVLVTFLAAVTSVFLEKYRKGAEWVKS